MFRWKRELDYLKTQAVARVAAELPPPVLEWFDLNRSGEMPLDQAAMASLQDRIEAAAATWDGAAWDQAWGGLHADAYGWRLLLQRYTRDGRAFFLLCVERDTKASERDEKRLDKMLTHLGADPEKDFLMSTRGEDDPDMEDFWTWPQGQLS